MTQMHERYAYAARHLPGPAARRSPGRAGCGWPSSVVFTLNLLAAVPPTPEIEALLPVARPLGIVGSIAMIGITVVAGRAGNDRDEHRLDGRLPTGMTGAELRRGRVRLRRPRGRRLRPDRLPRPGDDVLRRRVGLHRVRALTDPSTWWSAPQRALGTLIQILALSGHRRDRRHRLLCAVPGRRGADPRDRRGTRVRCCWSARPDRSSPLAGGGDHPRVRLRIREPLLGLPDRLPRVTGARAWRRCSSPTSGPHRGARRWSRSCSSRRWRPRGWGSSMSVAIGIEWLLDPRWRRWVPILALPAGAYLGVVPARRAAWHRGLPRPVLDRGTPRRIAVRPARTVECVREHHRPSRSSASGRWRSSRRGVRGRSCGTGSTRGPWRRSWPSPCSTRSSELPAAACSTASSTTRATRTCPGSWRSSRSGRCSGRSGLPATGRPRLVGDRGRSAAGWPRSRWSSTSAYSWPAGRSSWTEPT